jgi:PmbA protein
MDQQDAVAYVLALAREHSQPEVDLIVERSERLSLRVLNGQIEKTDHATELGLGIRVVHEGRTGISSSERLEAQALEKAFLAAKENALLNDPTEVVLPEAPGSIPDSQGLGLFNPDLETLTVESLGTLGLDIEAAALHADPRVKVVPHLVVSRSNAEYHLVSTHGVDYYQRQNSVGAYCQVLLEDQGQRKSGGSMWAQRVWDPVQGKQIGTLAVSKAADLLQARSVPGGRVPVVLDEFCAPQLLSRYFGCFSAEAAQKGQSRLQGKLGDLIADESIDLIDEPHRVGAVGSGYMDAEGSLTRRMPLIAKGKFEHFLYHIASARREGRESSGHAGRGYESGIVTTSHNIVMPTGTHTLDQLINIPEKCLLVTELEGAAGCNPLSGDISIGVQGFWVEQGQRCQPVDSMTIAGNFFDLLKAIRARGHIYQPNLTRMFIPALLIEGLTVSS